MTKKIKMNLLSSGETIAAAVKLCNAEVVNYPMPLGSEITSGVEAYSMNEALNMAVASILTGKRTFLATSLIDSLDDFYNISFQRLPLVIANLSRSIGA